jgi:hypothetical protein
VGGNLLRWWLDLGDLFRVYLQMFTNQKPLAAAIRASIRLRMSPNVRSLGGSSCANINRSKRAGRG